MSNRFQRQSSESHSGQKQRVCATDCRCCRALETARAAALFDALPEWGSPLTPGVQGVNLSHSLDERSLRVDLGHDWVRMFRQLAVVGDGLVMTRNTAAILGRRMTYPDIEFTADGAKGACGVSGLWLDLRGFRGARAVHMRRESGHLFGVEFANEGGCLVHRFTLTCESNMDDFFAWVRLHQACDLQTPARWSSDDAGCEWGELSASPWRVSEGGAISSVLAACVERELPVRVTVCGGAARQRGEFVPDSIQQLDEWWFVSDEVNGLHFQPELLPQVVVEEWTESDAGLRRALRCTTEDGATALLIGCASLEAEVEWQSLLENLA